MAQFIGFIKGQKSEVSRLGSKKSGLTARLNGWNIGLTVYLTHSEATGKDSIEVFRTGGSEGNATSQLVAVIEAGMTTGYPIIGQEAVPLVEIEGHRTVPVKNFE